jgi:hypothetical protein
MKKSASKKPSTVTSASVPVTPATTVASTNPIPTTVSSAPEGWVEPKRLGKKGRRPKHGLSLAAADLATELRKNAAAISQELGPKAVDPAQLAAALDDAHAWQGVEAKAGTFHVYARAQRGAAWDHAVTLMAGMKLGVRFAVARDASFADRFPGVAKAFAPTRRPKAPTAATDTVTTAAPKATRSRKKSTAVAAEPAVAVTPAPTPAPEAPPPATTA